MKLKKSQRSNLIFLAIIIVLIFTPVRGIIQVAMSKARVMILSPSEESERNRVVVANYDWKLKGINTEDTNINSLDEKVVFINFWATWCPPCRAEMPSIQNLYDDYKDKVEFVFVTSEKSETVINFLNKNEYNLPSYNQLNKKPSELHVSGIPATYVLNKKGEIVVHEVGAVDWNSNKFRKLLDELLSE